MLKLMNFLYIRTFEGILQFHDSSIVLSVLIILNLTFSQHNCKTLVREKNNSFYILGAMSIQNKMAKHGPAAETILSWRSNEGIRYDFIYPAIYSFRLKF